MVEQTEGKKDGEEELHNTEERQLGGAVSRINLVRRKGQQVPEAILGLSVHIVSQVFRSE